MKILSFLAPFISKNEKSSHFRIFYQANISTNVYYFWKFDIHGSTIVEITGHQSCYFVSFTTAYRDLITQRKTSTNSLIYLFESYYWKKCLVKVSSFLTYWLENEGPLKFLQNWTEKTFYRQFLASLEIIKVVI